MNIKNILLAIDGSMYSQRAAEVAWAIAKSTGASVTALHVLDTACVLDMIGHVDTGFLDAADYKEERDSIVHAMTSASNTLVQRYAEAARKAGIEVHAVVKAGNTFDIVNSAAQSADLVVVGHKPYDAELRGIHMKRLLRLSVAEYLSENLSVPLLVVQGSKTNWKSMTIMTSAEHINRAYIDAAVGLARQVGTQPALVCLSTSDIEEPPAELVADFRTSDAALADVPIAVAGMDVLRDRRFEEWDNPLPSDAWDRWDATLLAIPTRPIPGRRLTIADGAPARLVRYATVQAMLFYPEEIPPTPRETVAVGNEKARI
jgi:nucleotide-binding universal stress UspA family protein